MINGNFYLGNFIKKKFLSKEKNNYYLNFEGFKPFKINKIKVKKFDSDEVLILSNRDIVFEYWLKQRRLIPPWQTHWFQLKDNFLLKLKSKLLESLIKKAIKKSGNMNRLCRVIKMSYPTFYNFINKKEIKMISVKKLKRLLDYLDIPYESLNCRTEYTKKGKKVSIKNPKFPIDLSGLEGASLLGAIVSDGCIYIDKKSRNKIRTKYSSGEEESINRFIKNLNKVYGKVLVSREEIRNCVIIRIGSSIIGESLLKVGAILGHKAKVDGRVPWLIKYGDKRLKRAYLRSVFEDESSVFCDTKRLYKSYIIMSRYKHLKNLTNDQKGILDKLEKFMISRRFPTGHINKSISIKKALEKMDKDKKLIRDLNSAPRLLLDESFILRKFGIENRLYGRSLNKTHLGNYSICFDLFINKRESLKKFYKEIGFSLKHKRNKLTQIVGGSNGIKTV